MKTRERNKLIKMLKGIVEEIKEFKSYSSSCHFFICNSSRYQKAIKPYLPTIAKFGIAHLDGFEHGFAFTYGPKLSGEEYNQNKINHLELYIKHLESIKKEK